MVRENWNYTVHSKLKRTSQSIKLENASCHPWYVKTLLLVTTHTKTVCLIPLLPPVPSHILPMSKLPKTRLPMSWEQYSHQYTTCSLSLVLLMFRQSCSPVPAVTCEVTAICDRWQHQDTLQLMLWTSLEHLLGLTCDVQTCASGQNSIFQQNSAMMERIITHMHNLELPF